MKISNNKLIIINLITYILFLLPISKLDLFKENYSTLSLNTRGYFYLLFIGILIGLILYYETKRLNKKYSLLILISMIIGVIIPHHVPYNLQGNIHLLFSYTGSFIVVVLTLLNIFRFTELTNIYIFGVFISILSIFRYSMVTTLCEVILMSFILFCNLYAYIKTSSGN